MIKALGSLKFAIFLIVSLVVLLAASTFTESFYGTPFAQKVFYKAGWFDFFLALVWVNILCATLTRYPFKNQHIGFVITHIGILMLLAGTLLTRFFGVEGQMTVFEGGSKNTILQEGNRIKIVSPSHESISVDLPASLKKLPYELPVFKETNAKAFITKILKHASQTQVIQEGTAKDPINYALQATLASDRVGLHESFFLVTNDPENPQGSAKQIGPAHVELKSGKAEVNPHRPSLLITKKTNQETFSVELKENNPSDIPLEESGLTVHHLVYYPHAKIADQKLVNAPEEIGFNPAVEFEVRDDQGKVEHHTKFLIFPDFNSLRGGASNNFFDLDVRLEIPNPANEEDLRSPSFTVYASDQGPWTYRITSSQKPPVEGPLTPDQEITTGWMDIKIKTGRLFNRAKILRVFQESKETSSENVALEITTVKEDNTRTSRWLTADRPIRFETKKGAVQIALSPKEKAVPFSLKLKDFRKVDYPGTGSPASFESDVTLTDPKENISMEKTIRMNKPLDYKGYRIFQSSYIQDERLGEGSVFTVAKNPGIRLIYPGAVILFIGVVLLFYIHPFFSAAKQDESAAPFGGTGNQK